LAENPEGARPLGRPRSRWEVDIKIGLREIGWGDMDMICLAQDMERWRAFVNTVMDLCALKSWKILG
jgi:hypothetical protein